MSNYWTRRAVSRRAVLRGSGLALAGVTGAALIGCGSSEETSGGGGATATQTAATATQAPSTATPPPAEAAKQGGELIMSGGDLQKLDFQATISTPTQNASTHVFNTLIRYDPYTGPNDYSLIPGLAESWELGPDKIVFHLQKGIHWQDLDPVNGREFVAEDVKYSYERVGTDSAEFVHAYKVGPVSSIETPDDYTVVLNLKAPSASLPYDLASGQGMGIIPHEIVEKDGDLNTRWVGTGPFMLDTWEKGVRIRFVKNPNYFKSGQPYLDAIEWRFITDASVNLANFIAGELHYISVGSLEDAQQIGRSTKATVGTSPSLGGTHKLYNVGPMGAEPLKDLRIRQAIDLGLDRKQILDLVLGGDGVLAGPPLPAGYGVWSLPDEEIASSYPFDLAEAKKLVDAVGLGSITVDQEYANTSSFSQDEGPLMQQTLEQIGIHLNLKPLERTVYLQSQVDHTFQFMGIGMGSYPDPNNYLEPTFHSTKGSKNYGQAADPKMDAMIEKQQQILDQAERANYLHDMQRQWKDFLFRSYTVNSNVHSAWSEKVTGTFNPKGWDYQGMEAVSFA